MNYTDFRNQVKDRALFPTDGHAEKAIRAVLEVLGQRISEGQVDDMAPSLPLEIRPYLRQTRDAEPLTRSDFLLRISAKEGVDLTTAQEHARAVLSVLADAVPESELKDAFEQLPKNMRDLFAWMKKAA